MRYQIQAPPSVTVARQQEELARLRRYAGQLQLHWVRVGPPHRSEVELLQLLEVPERWAEHAQQLVAVLTGREDAATRTVYQVRRRAEWTTSLLLYPAAEAQALDSAVLDGAASAWLCVRSGWWGTLATLRVGVADVNAVLAAAGARGWAASPRGGQALLSQVRGTGRNTPLALGTGSTPAQAGPEKPSSPAATPLLDAAAAPSPLLAAADTPGWLLGVRDDGRAVELTWSNHIVALDGPREAVQGALRALVRRALGLPRDAAPGVPPDSSLGVLALLDRQLLDWPDLERFATRLWRLDSRDRWSSVMVPWRSLPPATLAEVLRWQGLNAPLPEPLPAGLDKLLAQLGGGHLVTEALRDLSAPPGDDMRAVLRAGGGLVQLRDGGPEEELLADLVLAVLAEPPALGRPLLLIRPAGLLIPPALALQAIQVVIGPEAGAAVTLRSSPGGQGGWHLTWADGSAPLALQADLDAEPLSTRDQIHARIITGLGQAGAAVGMGAAILAGAPGEEAWEALASAALAETDEGGVPEIPAGLVGATGEDDAPGEEPWEALVDAAFGVAAAKDAVGEISVDPAVVGRDELDGEMPAAVPAGVLDEAAWEALAGAALGAQDEHPATDLDLGGDAPAETDARPDQRRGVPIRRRPRQRFGATRMLARSEVVDPDQALVEQPDDQEADQPAKALMLGERNIAEETPAPLIGDVPGDTPFWLAAPSHGADDPLHAPSLPLADWEGAAEPAPQQATAEAVEQPLHSAGEPSHSTPSLHTGWAFPAEPAPLAGVLSHRPDAEQPQHATAAQVEQPSHGTVTAPDQRVYRVSLDDPASWHAAWQAGVAQAELLRCLQALAPATDRVALRQQLRALLASATASLAAPVTAPSPIAAASPVAAVVLSPTPLASSAPVHATEPHPAQPPAVASPPLHATTTEAVAQPAAAPTGLVGATLDDPDAQAIWTAWQAGEPLEQLLIARCGYARGKAAEQIKDRIYHVVVPQILRTLQAEALVPALLAGAELAGEQVEQYEQVLRQLARIDRPVTGVLRTQMHARLVQVLQLQEV